MLPPRLIEVEAVRALADKLNGKTWRAVKKELSAMTQEKEVPSNYTVD